MSNQKRVVIKRPGQPAAIEMIKPGLEPLQEIVGGYIETGMKAHHFFDDGHLVAYVNEEGHVRDLPHNILRPSDQWPLAGALVVVKVDEYGDDGEMSEEEAERALQLIASMKEAA